MRPTHDSAALEPEDLVDPDISSTALVELPKILKSLEARTEEEVATPCSPGDSWAGRAWHAINAVDRFVRLHFLSFSALLVLLGAASVRPLLGWTELLGLLAVALCFHNFAYVFNDVIDLPVDRGCPSRQQDPLVRGAISPGQALAFSLGQVPLAAALHLAFGWPIEALAVLLAGFAFMAIYDLWGKACPLPPLTDLSQGLGWASLALYGALALGDGPNALTWTAFGLGCGFILLINGVHGGLRDLANDLAKDRRTTAIFFGSRPTGNGGTATVKPGLKLFAMGVQLALVAVAAIPLWRNEFGFARETWWLVAMALVLVEAQCLRLMLRVFRTDSDTWGRDFRLHLFFLLLPTVVLFAPYLESRARFLFVLLFFLPCLLFPTTHELARKAANALASTLRSPATGRFQPPRIESQPAEGPRMIEEDPSSHRRGSRGQEAGRRASKGTTMTGLPSAAPSDSFSRTR